MAQIWAEQRILMVIMVKEWRDIILHLQTHRRHHTANPHSHHRWLHQPRHLHQYCNSMAQA
jgi:hypothetical protein